MYIVMHVKDPDTQNIKKLLLLALKAFLEQSGNSPLGTSYEQKLGYVDIDIYGILPEFINTDKVYEIWDELHRGFIDLYEDSNLYNDYDDRQLIRYGEVQDRKIRELLKLPEKPFEIEGGATK